MESKSLILGFDDNGRLFFSVENFWDWNLLFLKDQGVDFLRLKELFKDHDDFLLLGELLRSSFYFRGTTFSISRFFAELFLLLVRIFTFWWPSKRQKQYQGLTFSWSVRVSTSTPSHLQKINKIKIYTYSFIIKRL